MHFIYVTPVQACKLLPIHDIKGSTGLLLNMQAAVDLVDLLPYLNPREACAVFKLVTSASNFKLTCFVSSQPNIKPLNV